jgi:hypothetical protein
LFGRNNSDCTNGTSRMGRAPMPMIHYDMGFTSRLAHPTLAACQLLEFIEPTDLVLQFVSRDWV